MSLRACSLQRPHPRLGRRLRRHICSGESVVITLPLATVLSIATACAPSVDAHMLAGIAEHESGLRPYAVHDNTTGKSTFAGAKADAIGIASELLRQGHNLDLGLWQINNRNLGLLHLSVDEAFDTCEAAGGAARLIHLFSKYNTGSPTKGIENGYATGVVSATRRVKSAMAAIREVPPTDSSAISQNCHAPAWDTWGQEECRERQEAAAEDQQITDEDAR